MKTMLFNGSPRRKGNTEKLLQKVMEGVKSAGSETKLIHLYDYLYSGCKSCFTCKRKGNTTNGLCVLKDDITPILHEAINADVLVFGSPVYLHDVTGMMRCFLERMLYPLISYIKDPVNGGRKRVFTGVKPTAFIFSMNNPEKNSNTLRYDILLGNNCNLLERNLGYCEALYVYDTIQFDNYSDYMADFFDESYKKEMERIDFPKKLNEARKMGERLVKMVRLNSKQE